MTAGKPVARCQGTGGIAYFIVARLLGVFTLAELVRQFSRKGRKA